MVTHVGTYQAQRCLTVRETGFQSDAAVSLLHSELVDYLFGLIGYRAQIIGQWKKHA